MSRSLKKPAYVCPAIIKKIRRNQEKGYSVAIKTWSRASTISVEMINTILLIHNGLKFIKVLITADMVGCKVGEFSPTRNSGKGHGKAGKH